MAQVIVVALGIQVRDWDGPGVNKFLKAHCDPQKGAVWTYPKGATSKATHEVHLVYGMADFTRSLDTNGAWVVYDGHSRYGQGPAFGPAKTPELPDKKTFPTNPWGVHFRMGYDATDTESIEDILHHSVTPAEYDLPAAGASAFLPSALVKASTRAKARATAIAGRKIKSAGVCGTGGAWRSFDTCWAKLAAKKTIRGEQPLKGRHYYAWLRRKPADDFMTAVEVGSTDLNRSSLACSLLFMASCSSRVHYFDPLDRRRKAAKSACKFLLTANVCSAAHALIFLRQVLIKRRDPMTTRGARDLLKALNGVSGAGLVRMY